METMYHMITQIINFLLNQMVQLISLPFDSLLDLFKHLFS